MDKKDMRIFLYKLLVFQVVVYILFGFMGGRSFLPAVLLVFTISVISTFVIPMVTLFRKK